MATVQDVKEAAQRLQNTLDTAMRSSPCMDSTSCVQTAKDIGPQIEINVAAFVACDPDPSSCPPAVAALDALATAFAETPPVDPASSWAIETCVADAVLALNL